jgi:hypothetical protein
MLVDGEDVPLGRVTRTVWHPAGAIPGTIGACVGGEARFNRTLLASIYWAGVCNKTFDRVCAVLGVDELGECVCGGSFEAVKLDNSNGASNPRARILEILDSGAQGPASPEQAGPQPVRPAWWRLGRWRP